MEPLEIFDVVNDKVIRVFVTSEVAEKCRTDTDFAQDLFNKLQDQQIEEGCEVEVETIKAEESEGDGPVQGEGEVEVENEYIQIEKQQDKEVWSRHDTLKLIKTYKKYKDSFKQHKQRKIVWAMIAAELLQYNVFKSATKCSVKWKNLIRTYKSASEKPNTPTRFQFYQEMKDIFNDTSVPISDSEMDEQDETIHHQSFTIDVGRDKSVSEVAEKESWTRYETLKFLKAFQMLKHMKQSFSKERHFWSMISAQLAKDNIHKHYEKCAAKWKNLLRSYRKNLEKTNMPTRFQYFQEVNDVLNDAELEIPDDVMITDGVEKIVDSEQFNAILEEAELETSKDAVSWTADETLKLIEGYKKHKFKFGKYPSRRHVWTLVSYDLANQGIDKDAEKLENKWKSLMRSYKKVDQKGEVSSRFYFYDEMCKALNYTEESANQDDSQINQEKCIVNKVEAPFPNLDHAYSENADCEQIIIQTESNANEDNIKTNTTWSYSETSSLLSTFSDCRKKFKNLEKTELWEQVANELHSVGINKSGLDCEKKWKELFSVYKIHKLGKLGPDGFQFYQAIEEILKNDVEIHDNNGIACKRCKCSEKKMLEKQNRHIERMQMLKRKLDLEERKVEAFEHYVKHLRGSGSS